MPELKTTQGPWTRIRPLRRDELDDNTSAGVTAADITWHIRSNLAKVMAYLPRMTQTSVEYVNSFTFDPPTFRGGVQEAGFNDRFLKELVISKTSLINRSRYSVMHHGLIGMLLYTQAGRRDEGHVKFLHLHEHERFPDVYTERERVVLDYTDKVTRDAHLVTDADYGNLRRALDAHNRIEPPAGRDPQADAERLVDQQIVELTWLIGHFCLLNRWFTALQVPNEGALDEDDFQAFYEQVVPADVRTRNEAILQGQF